MRRELCQNTSCYAQKVTAAPQTPGTAAGAHSASPADSASGGRASVHPRTHALLPCTPPSRPRLSSSPPLRRCCSQPPRRARLPTAAAGPFLVCMLPVPSTPCRCSRAPCTACSSSMRTSGALVVLASGHRGACPGGAARRPSALPVDAGTPPPERPHSTRSHDPPARHFAPFLTIVKALVQQRRTNHVLIKKTHDRTGKTSFGPPPLESGISDSFEKPL